MLAGNVMLALNFSAAELGASDPAATDQIVSNLRQVAAWLQKARDVLGVPLRVTSGFRTWAHNTAVGGSPTSDHPNGLAADFEAVGMTPYDVYTRLQTAAASGLLPRFDQLIFYVADDHVHVGLGARMRGEVLLKTTEGSYLALAGDLATKLRGYL